MRGCAELQSTFRILWRQPKAVHMERIGFSLAVLCLLSSMGAEASAQRLIPASPTAPVAFTFPPVHDYTDPARIRRVHVIKRGRLHRRAYVRRPVRRFVASHSDSISEWRYQSLLTGWRPLPYEFGPYSARVVILR